MSEEIFVNWEGEDVSYNQKLTEDSVFVVLEEEDEVTDSLDFIRRHQFS